jgi:secreted trypsin-like serine protease
LQQRQRADGSSVSAGSLRLLQVSLPMVSTTDCAARGPGNCVGDGQICAGFEGGATRRDSCNGDSGGPLVVHEARGCPTQVGLVSWARLDCGLPKTYGVYRRLSYHVDWRRQQIPGLAPNLQSVGASTADLTAQEFVEQVAELIEKPASGFAGGNIVRNGGTFVFEARSETGGRLVIIDVHAEGVATQICPNEFVTDGDKSFIKAGQAVAVPGPH